MNLPNRLTVARVALIPVMVVLMYVGGTVCNLLAAAVFGLAVVILARELCVDGLRMVAVTKGQVIAAGKLGKIKTVSQIVLILWLMLLRQPVTQSLLSGAVCLIVVVLTLWSGADYFVKNSGVLMEKDAK